MCFPLLVIKAYLGGALTAFLPDSFSFPGGRVQEHLKYTVHRVSPRAKEWFEHIHCYLILFFSHLYLREAVL